MFRGEDIHRPGFFAIYGLMRDGEEIHNGVHMEPGREWYWEQSILARLKVSWRHMVLIRRLDEDLAFRDGKRSEIAHAHACLLCVKSESACSRIVVKFSLSRPRSSIASSVISISVSAVEPYRQAGPEEIKVAIRHVAFRGRNVFLGRGGS